MGHGLLGNAQSLQALRHVFSGRPHAIGMSDPGAQSWPEGLEQDEDFATEALEEQWIVEVTDVSSQYGISVSWSADQVVGPPRVLNYSDNGLAWAPDTLFSCSKSIRPRIRNNCFWQRLRDVDVLVRLVSPVKMTDGDGTRPISRVEVLIAHHGGTRHDGGLRECSHFSPLPSSNCILRSKQI